MEKKIPEFKNYEPLRSNRWLIETYPTKINPYLFRKYKMFNEGKEIIFKTEFFEIVQESYNPIDLMNITDITLNYLDPINEVVGGFKMLVGGMNFEKNHSYSNDDLLTTKLRFVIKEIEPILKDKKI